MNCVCCGFPLKGGTYNRRMHNECGKKLMEKRKIVYSSPVERRKITIISRDLLPKKERIKEREYARKQYRRKKFYENRNGVV